MSAQRTGTADEHLAARLELLEQEKDLTRRSDELARRRRELPRVRVDKQYLFDTGRGEMTLADLFDGRSQLLVDHFMFAPSWTEGCKSCSFWADGYDTTLPHLNAHGVSFVAVSRAPLASLDAYKRRMGWTFPWVSSARSDFSYDYGVCFREPDYTGTYNFTQPAGTSDLPGLSAFALVDGVIYHTYSCYARGLDSLNGTYQLLDRSPLGRDEVAGGESMSWVRRHDEYGTSPADL